MYIITRNFIDIWTPMLAIVATHIAMFLELRKQARIRAQSTGADTSKHIQGISRTFLLIVFAFFACMLPTTVSGIVGIESFLATQAWNYSILLANFNSCLNPLIYAKIHQKIYIRMKTMFRGVLQRVRVYFGKQSTDASGSKDSNRNIPSAANIGRTKYSDVMDKNYEIEMVEFDNGSGKRSNRPARSDKKDKDLSNISIFTDAEVVEATKHTTAPTTLSHVDLIETSSNTVSNVSTARDVEEIHITCNVRNHGYEPDENGTTIL